MPPTLYLLDGHALAYRAYFALTVSGGGAQRWQTSTGEPTAGIYGFASTLLRILEQEKPDYIAVAFDTGKTFRDEIFPEYKGTRAKMPDDLRPQIERIRQLVDAFNIPRLEMSGFEADDVLGSIARQAAAQGLGVKILTGDRDLLQLVGERIIVNLPGKSLSDASDFITDAAVAEYFGVPPGQVVDYKALVGDKSDNIPGVQGIGEKTAQTLLGKFGDLDAIYARLAEIETRWRTKLEAGRESAYLSRKLAAIRTDLPVKLDLEQAKAGEFDPARIEEFFRELEFLSLIKRLQSLTNSLSGETSTANPKGQLSMFGAEPKAIYAPQTTVSIDVSVVDTPQKLADLARELAKASVISFDTETTSTDEMQAELVGISLAVQPGKGIYIPVGHTAGENLPLEQVISALRPAFTDKKIGKVAHNAKYDYIMLARHGLIVAPITFDTMIAEFVVDPGSHNLGLKNLAFVRLGDEMTRIEDLIGTGKKQISMAEVAIESAAAYAAADAETTLRLMPLLQEELERGKGLQIMREIEMPLVPVLAQMEMSGVLVDTAYFGKLGEQMAGRMAEIEKQVFEAVGQPFNINSTQQLSDILFNRLRLEPPDRGRKTASGHFSTSADILEALRGKHVVVDWVLEHRELSKLKSTYIDALLAAVDSHTGRVHTSYSQSGAVTGRLSSSNPNLQNIPIRTEAGRRIRDGFIAAPGNVLLSVDYSQIELRIVAHMAHDEGMLAAFAAGQDIHATTAAAIYNIPLEQVTKEMRRHAKAINFGLIYGMSVFGLTRSTDLTLAEAEDFVAAYFKHFQGVKKYLDGIRQSAAREGYVETLLGRRRYFPALKSQLNHNLKNREEREAINAPIQGTAADLIKIAMLRIPQALQQAGLKGQLLLQVHDELVLECPRGEVERTASLVQEIMGSAYKLDVPLSTEARWGPNWGEMQAIP